MDVIEQTKTKMRQAIDHLKAELKGVRTGKANPGMVDTVMVEIDGAHVRIKAVASISAPEPRQLLLTPFDPKNAPFIAKGIERANLGINPIVDGRVVRIKIPPMDEAMRKEMVKLCHKKAEEAKVSIRNIRRDSNDALKKQKSDGSLPEDLFKKFEKNIQEQTDQFCKEADEVSKSKEAEVMHI